MKNRKFTAALAATALLLPIATFAQSSSSSTSGSSSPPSSASSTQRQDAQKQQQKQQQQKQQQDRQYGTSSSTSTPSSTSSSASTPSSTMSPSASASLSATASGDIRRINQEQLQSRVTATDVIGKNVVGRNGDKIGDIKDVGFGTALPENFRQVTHKQQQKQQQKQQSTQAQAARTTGVESSTTAATTAGTGSSATRSSTSGMMSSSSSAMERELMVYISVGGFMGLGEDLVAVPASQLQYDQQNDRFTIDRTAEDITRLAEAEKPSSSSAAE